jgi:hypothetical protein
MSQNTLIFYINQILLKTWALQWEEMQWAKPNTEQTKMVVVWPKLMVGQSSIESVLEKTWWWCHVGAEEAYVIFIEVVAWESLVGRPCVGCPVSHLAFLAPTSTNTPPYSPYKCPHSLHGENHIRVQVISFQVLPLPYIIEWVERWGS